ncbi:MAG: spore germination protein [Ruminococcus sp.]|nr:spore germination protein [Ruminococcus sp.]
MFTDSYENNRILLAKLLRSDECFDIIERNIVIAGKKAVIFYINGLIKDDIMEKLMEFFYNNTRPEYLSSAEEFCRHCVPYVEISVVKDPDMVVKNVLSGIPCLMAEGFSSAISFDMRTYPQRNASEPEDDKVLRGSKDGFVETVIFNSALIRRRIRSGNFITKAMTVGRESKSDIIVCYMDNKVDHNLLHNITDRIKNLDIENLSMNQQSLIEALYQKKWLNPFPKVKYTERPDVAAAVCLKGNIVILVDNSPSALLIPTSIFDVLEEADDYYFPPITGTYIRITRYLITFASVMLTPLWLLCLQNPEHVPQVFRFVLAVEPTSLPIYWQLIIMELCIDGLRLAALHTPNSLTSAIGIIGAIAFSQFAVDAGWFTTASTLYVAFVTIANYSQPNYELGFSLKYARFILLTTTAVGNLIGFIAGLVLLFILLATNKTISGKSYLYPLIPFKPQELKKKLTRTRMQQN